MANTSQAGCSGLLTPPPERVDWSAPSVGDPVTVVSEGGDTRNGVVMLRLHIDDKAPPSNDPHDHVTAYCDGATMTYNTKITL